MSSSKRGKARAHSDVTEILDEEECSLKVKKVVEENTQGDKEENRHALGCLVLFLCSYLSLLLCGAVSRFFNLFLFCYCFLLPSLLLLFMCVRMCASHSFQLFLDPFT